MSHAEGAVPQSAGRTDGPPTWYLRGAPLDTGLRPVSAFDDDRHPDGGVLDAPDADASSADEADALWRAVPSARGMVRIDFADRAPVPALPLWFVLVDEPAASRPAANLVAYEGDRFEPGTVVSPYTYRAEGIDHRTQAGAVRWYRDGLVHQIFVRPDRRRAGIGTVLLWTANAVHLSKAWSGRLHGDGRRTELGEQLVGALGHPDRIAALTEIMPPMDPA